MTIGNPSNRLIIQTPCTLLTGFLGAGKTSLLNQLLTLKSTDGCWALLINEFGKIGIDSHLIDRQLMDHGNGEQTKQIAIREVSGGCICCTSQLPLQIALTRLLTEHHPERLFIEPTGLAHPNSLLTQLSEPHWQTSLELKTVICVLSAFQWQDSKYREHEGYQAHVKYADLVAVNRYEHLTSQQRQHLVDWISNLNPHAKVLWLERLSADLKDALQQPSQLMQRLRAQQKAQTRILLSHPSLSRSGIRRTSEGTHLPQQDTSVPEMTADEELPYRYHDQQQGMVVGGWRLPKTWLFDAHKLQDWLLSLPNWQRIKGLLNTNEGWLRFNFTPDSIKVSSTEAQTDNRLEIILSEADATQLDKTSYYQQRWQQWDDELMQLVLDSLARA